MEGRERRDEMRFEDEMREMNNHESARHQWNINSFVEERADFYVPSPSQSMFLRGSCTVLFYRRPVIFRVICGARVE